MSIDQSILEMQLLSNMHDLDVNMKWSNVPTVEKKFPKTTTYTVTCVELLSAMNAEPWDCVLPVLSFGKPK